MGFIDNEGSLEFVKKKLIYRGFTLVIKNSSIIFRQ